MVFFNFALHNYGKRTINRKLSYYNNSLCYCKYSIMHDGKTYTVHAFSTSTTNRKPRDHTFYNRATIREILNWIELRTCVKYLSNGSNVIARDRWCVWKLEFPEKSCSSWRPPFRFTYNHCKVLVMNPHVSSWDAREVIDSILWWVFHLVRSRISLNFFSSRINNIYYISSRGFFLKHDCFNRWEWKQTCKNSTLYN